MLLSHIDVSLPFPSVKAMKICPQVRIKKNESVSLCLFPHLLLQIKIENINYMGLIQS